jgi:hypothetical protein
VKENNIEEAIERLEYIDRAYSCNNYYSVWDLKCIETLLSDYKRVFKENERYQKSDYETICLENKELKEINERLESENQEFLYKYGNVLKENKELNEKWDKDTHKLQNDLDIANAKIIELLKENEELKDKYATFVKMSSEVIANSIPKQKVKDKIQELLEGRKNE